MARKTKEDTQATREGILDAAEACFHEHGVARTTLEMIGARAGYTRGAVYWHFKNKSEVLAAIVERVHLPFMQELERPLSMPGVFASFFMVFIPTIGEYVTPLLVGGSRGFLYGNIIQDFFTKAANWPLGSALSMIMLAATLILLAFATRLIDLRQLFE